ncbi:MAG: cytochrome c oxidase assembly factor 1 family protein [Planctomycetaceae bacterium]|nr:cytochrome c oxidase assembly factor 1 family protein [Planctomycetaceae bacterium]
MSLKEIEKQALQGMTRIHPSRSWWSRNWCWFSVTVFASVVVLGGGLIYWALFWRTYHSTLFLASMEKIQADPAIQKALGDPVSIGNWPAPSARWDAAEQDLRWPLVGPKGPAKAHVTARLLRDQWETIELEVVLPNGHRIAVADKTSNQNDAPAYVPTSPAKKAGDANTSPPAPTINLPTPPSDDAMK